MLEVHDARVAYEGTEVLHAVSLTVPDGAVVAVLGPSGSGKSTLLRAIAGLEPLTGGTVRWDGADLASVPPHRRRFGLLFQDHALFPHRDVLGNVAFGLRMQHREHRVVQQRAREVLELVGLSGFEHRRVRELSGGEQQRVALARALAPEPRLLLLDEPFASLDRALRERLLVELRDLFTRLGLTALTVTHDQEEAFALADEVVLLRDGSVEQRGAPAEMWRAPATEFAARFLGFTNIVDASLRRTGPDAGVLSTPWGDLPVDGAALVHVDGDGPVRVAVRPAGLRLLARVRDDDAGLPGTVTSRTFRRDHYLLRVDVAGVGPLEVAAAVSEPPRVDDTVCVHIDAGAAVVLPIEAPPASRARPPT